MCRITWKNLSPVSRDPGTVIPGSRLTGLAWLSCNREIDFFVCLTNMPRSRQTDASPADVIRPLKIIYKSRDIKGSTNSQIHHFLPCHECIAFNQSTMCHKQHEDVAQIPMRIFALIYL